MTVSAKDAFIWKLRQRPLLPIATCFTMGILGAHFVRIPMSYLFVSAFTFILVAPFFGRGGFYILLFAFLSAGAANYAVRTTVLAPDDLRNIIGSDPREAIICGTLVETPYQRVFNRDGSERWRTLARIRTESLAVEGQWTSAFGDVIVMTPDIIEDDFYQGKRVQVQGVIRQPPRALAEGLFDYRDYLKTLGIHYQLIVASTNDWHLTVNPAGLPLSVRFMPWAREMLAQGLPQDRYVQLLWAMTLGWKTALSGEVAEPFMRSGTMHVFAISGLHIALIAGILVGSLKLFGLRRVTCAWVVLPLIWTYTGVTGWQASAIRSTIMSSVIIAGWCLRRPPNLLNSLMAAGLIILAWDPLQLFQAGFQLSFFVVLALALLTPALDKLRIRMLAPDPFLAPRFLTRRWRWTNAGAHAVLASFAVSLAAWAGSLPLIAHYFHLLTPITLLANMIVVPLSSGALACNLATLAIGPLLPSAGELFNNCAWLLMMLMVKVSEWAASLPMVVLHVRALGAATCILYYTLVIVFFSGWLFRARVWKWSAGLASAAAIPLIWQLRQTEPATQVTVLPLQGGSAVYIKEPHHNLLIDCGANESGRLITKTFLQAQGVNRLRDLVLTHGDVRHVEAAPLMYRTFAEPAVYMSPVRFLSAPYRKVQAYFQTNGVVINQISTGDHVGSWEVLHPDREHKFSQADDNAIVMLGNVMGRRVLLLSDLGIRGQNALIERNPELRADIVVTGLPRESEAVADGFLDVVQPKTVIVTDAEQERANERLRARLAKRGANVLYTSDLGAVTISFYKNREVHVETRGGG
jgi:competence protein ComEC